MTQVFWAGEFLRVYVFIVVTIVGSRVVLVASGESSRWRCDDALFGWMIRAGVAWMAASALGYL